MHSQFHQTLHAAQRGCARQVPGAKEAHVHAAFGKLNGGPGVVWEWLSVTHGDALGKIAAGPIRESKTFPWLGGAGPVGRVRPCDWLRLHLLQALLELRQITPCGERFPSVVNHVNPRAQVCRQSVGLPVRGFYRHAVAAVKKSSEVLQKRGSRGLKLANDLGHFGRKRHQLAADGFWQRPE